MALFGRKQVVVQINANVQWEVTQDPESRRYIGVCHPFNVTAIGETFEDFLAAAGETLAMLFQDLLEENELDSFMQRQGWTLMQALPGPGVQVKWDVPFNVAQKNRIAAFEPA